MKSAVRPPLFSRSSFTLSPEGIAPGSPRHTLSTKLSRLASYFASFVLSLPFAG
jgi:hypothetical protein